MRTALVIVALAGVAHADPQVDALEKKLPPGWSLLHTETELVIRHDRPVYVVGAASAPSITLELRYRLEPRWTPKQLADARAANDRIAAALRDQRAKLSPAAYQKAAAQAAAREVKLPRCTLGGASLFDGDDTYAQLALELDPARAHADAEQVAQLVREACGAPPVSSPAAASLVVASPAEARAAVGKLVAVKGALSREKLGDTIVSGELRVRCLDVRFPDNQTGVVTASGTLDVATDEPVARTGAIRQGVGEAQQVFVLRNCVTH